MEVSTGTEQSLQAVQLDFAAWLESSNQNHTAPGGRSSELPYAFEPALLLGGGSNGRWKSQTSHQYSPAPYFRSSQNDPVIGPHTTAMPDLERPDAQAETLQNRMFSSVNKLFQEFHATSVVSRDAQAAKQQQQQQQQASAAQTTEADPFCGLINRQREFSHTRRGSTADFRAQSEIRRSSLQNLTWQVERGNLDFAREVEQTAVMNDLWDQSFHRLDAPDKSFSSDDQLDRMRYCPPAWLRHIRKYNAMRPPHAHITSWNADMYNLVLRMSEIGNCCLCKVPAFYGAGNQINPMKCPALKELKLANGAWFQRNWPLGRKLQPLPVCLAWLDGRALTQHDDVAMLMGDEMTRMQLTIVAATVTCTHLCSDYSLTQILKCLQPSVSSQLCTQYRVDSKVHMQLVESFRRAIAPTETGKVGTCVDLYGFFRVVPLICVFGLEQHYPAAWLLRNKGFDRPSTDANKTLSSAAAFGAGDCWHCVCHSYEEFQTNRIISAPEDIAIASGVSTLNLHSLWQKLLAPCLDLMQDWGQKVIPRNYLEFANASPEDLFVPFVVLQAVNFNFLCTITPCS